ncbi:hypothetical protein L1049_011858 [Liquidambar formosana]|uniref:non-specific serine/threonine protein kinase n=1 Tax=Liquidambar formosana TaxID=63359 RepID=A0AAP0RS09_LIQFO
MGLPVMNLRSLLNVLNHIVLVSCFSLLHSGFTTRATSILGRNETDRLALLDIKAKITHDPFQAISSWNDSIHFCQWHGITCSHRRQRVTMLDLHSLQLAGSMSPRIGNLSFLRVLDLHNNSFSHEIPREIGQLLRLKRLRLTNNSFGGEIPASISRCSNLTFLSVEGNKLEGTIPMVLGSLSKLQVIYLGYNNLTGDIPPSLGNLSSLNELFAGQNYLQGSIPDSLGQLSYLTSFELGGNRLSGIIPPSLYNLSSITHFMVSENQIQGTLPPDLGITLPNLQYFYIAMNQFSGSIPISMSNASNLLGFEIVDNRFIGRVPSMANLLSVWDVQVSYNNLGTGEGDDLDFLSSLTNCTSLEILDIGENNFGGVLPESISNLSTKLWLMGLEENQILGNIPAGIADLVSLELLDLGYNQLTSRIPHDIGKLGNLKSFNLRGNNLSGDIPSSLGNLTLLLDLNLNSNNLQGSIPKSLGNCSSLIAMVLSENNLTGTIPKQVIGLSSLSIVLDLSRNLLTGSLPIEVGNLRNLGHLNVSQNNLSGEIPSSLGSCTSLVSLHMEGNYFQGTISSSLSSLRAIDDLDLSHNNLSGQIPIYLESFAYLQRLNLSFNNFEGEVPMQGVFKNSSAISVIGNKKLCGGIAQLQLQKCTAKELTKQRLSPKLKVLISVISGFLGLSFIFYFLKLYWSRKKRRETSLDSTFDLSLLKLSYERLLEATDGFSLANLIGVGGFGSVYKGVLGPDEPIVAVKVLNLQHKGASKSFIAECEALRNIRHRNLVKVLTACSSVDFQGNDFKALVYEFMVNGSLEDWLHPQHRVDEAHEQRSLSLLQRINIAIDVANALDYLHHHCHAPIIHCDLKPSNILMDSDMTAHVGDFGLVRFHPEASHEISSNQTSSIGIKGSIGYAPPEYGMGSEVSTYGDVYSYGILLLEMFIGKRPIDGMFKHGLNLHNFAMMALPERVVEIADPTLLQKIKEEEASIKTTQNRRLVSSDRSQKCLISVVRIGVGCSAELPRERMDITDVVAELYLVRDSLMGIGVHDECLPVQ